MRDYQRAVFLSVLFLAMWAPLSRSQDVAQTERTWDESQKPIVDSVQKYTEAFNKGDVALLQPFYAEDVRLTTVDGDVIEGRDAVLALCREGFEGNPGLKLRPDVRSVRLVGEHTAIESGFLSTTTTADPVENTIAYRVIHVKRDGTWLIFDIFETASADRETKEPHAEKLAVLDFMVGDWVEETESATVEHHARWTTNHRFLLIDYMAETGEGKPGLVAEQRVGWDPRSRSIRSWVFETDGGHATAYWTPSTDGKSLTIKSEVVLADGRIVTGTTVCERVAEGRMEIRTYDRSADGETIDDAPVRHLVRKLKPNKK